MQRREARIIELHLTQIQLRHCTERSNLETADVRFTFLQFFTIRSYGLQPVFEDYHGRGL